MKMFPLWDLEEAMSSFGRLNNEEKEIYQRLYTEGYDILYPIFYTIFISYTFYVLNSSTNKLPQYTLVVSIVTLISDLLENFCVYHMLTYYPDRQAHWLSTQLRQLVEPYARMGRFFTGVKAVTFFTMVFLILVSLGFWFRQFISSGKKSKTS